MFKYTGGEKVKKGNYWSFSTGERIRFETEEVLPGNSKYIYLRAPSGVLLLVIAPILGLVYAAFLPVVSIAIPFIIAGKKILNMAGERARLHKEPDPVVGTK